MSSSARHAPGHPRSWYVERSEFINPEGINAARHHGPAHGAHQLLERFWIEKIHVFVHLDHRGGAHQAQPDGGPRGQQNHVLRQPLREVQRAKGCLVGNLNENQLAWRGHLRDLAEHLARIVYVLQHVAGNNQVEGLGPAGIQIL